MNLFSIHTGLFKLDGGAMFGVVPKTIWNKIIPADGNNLISLAMRCLLIEDGDRLILIDNGIGDKQDTRFFNHYYLHGEESLDSSLAMHGFLRTDITDVLLTHLHFDHCGGSIIRKENKLIPAFENATFWSNETHWNWATEPNEREKASFLKENILPIRASGRLKMIPVNEGFEFSENINIRFVHGHTKAMMLPQITYKGKTVIFAADLLPSSGHIPLPYIMAYDMFPLTTLNEKKAFLTEGLAKDFILFFEHDPLIECCDLQLTDKGIRVKNSFKIKEL